MHNPLKDFNILIADLDWNLATVLRDMLYKMQFSTVLTTSSGKQALEMLGEKQYDFLLTDSRTNDMSGIDLVHHIRHDKAPSEPTLPVIMLSGVPEWHEVIAARDAGVNEFVAKPFSARSIYSRIERVIECPRNFVASSNFVGPDRRTKGVPPAGMKDRRAKAKPPTPRPEKVRIAMRSIETPTVWVPDYALKHKLGSVLLESIITPERLEEAQSVISNVAIGAMQWIKEDLDALQGLCDVLAKGERQSTIAEEIAGLALTLRSRAAIFDYENVTEIADLLYQFANKRLKPGDDDMHIVVQSHIQVMRIVFAGSEGKENKEVALLIDELKTLVKD